VIDSYFTHEMQRLLRPLPTMTRASTACERKLPRLHAARVTNKYDAEEVLTAQ
jgi:hypothetical protein